MLCLRICSFYTNIPVLVQTFYGVLYELSDEVKAIDSAVERKKRLPPAAIGHLGNFR